MLKIILALVIALQIVILPLLLFLVYLFISSGGNFNILLPGLGLIVSGGFVLLLVAVLEAVLFFLSLILFRQIRRESNKFD